MNSGNGSNLNFVYRVIVVFFLAEVVLSICATVISSRAACCPQAPVFIVESNPVQSQNVSDAVNIIIGEAPPPRYEDLFCGEGNANGGSSKVA